MNTLTDDEREVVKAALATFINSQRMRQGVVTTLGEALEMERRIKMAERLLYGLKEVPNAK